MVTVISDTYDIPRFGDFGNVVEDEVVPTIETLLRNKAVTGAVINGSYPRGDHSKASDIDVLVMYCSLPALDKLKRSQKRASKNYKISVQYSLFHNALAGTPFHRNSFSYLQHIAANPHEKIVLGKNPAIEIIEPYLIKRDDQRVLHACSMGALFDIMLKRYMEKDDDKAWYKHFIGGCLDKPVHYARAAVQLIHDGLPDDSGVKKDKNSDLIKEFYKMFPTKSPIGGKLAKILKVNLEYKKFINTCNPSDNSNKKLLRFYGRIEGTFPLIHDFMVETALALNRDYFTYSIT